MTFFRWLLSRDPSQLHLIALKRVLFEALLNVEALAFYDVQCVYNKRPPTSWPHICPEQMAYRDVLTLSTGARFLVWDCARESHHQIETVRFGSAFVSEGVSDAAIDTISSRLRCGDCGSDCEHHAITLLSWDKENGEVDRRDAAEKTA